MKHVRKLKSNYLISTVISNLNIGLQRKLRFIKITKTTIAIRLLRILYKEGVIRTFVITNMDIILVYFKYTDGMNLCAKLTLISRPGKRCFWNLNRLAKVYNIILLWDFI